MTISYASSTVYRSHFVYEPFHSFGYAGTSRGNDSSSMMCQCRTFYWTKFTMSEIHVFNENYNEEMDNSDLQV